ncbi:MAG: NusG domain II-containing protein [Firmicutes bacterium]|nr:NusG domain II-containing protein [Bacillota bacterium]
MENCPNIEKPRRQEYKSGGFKAFVKLDIIIYVLVVVLVISVLWIPREQGEVLRIYRSGVLYGEFDMQVDQVIQVQNGSSTAIIRIHDGQAFFSFANCPSRRCVRDGPVWFTGGARVCAEGGIRFRIVRAGDSGGGGIQVPPSR